MKYSLDDIKDMIKRSRYYTNPDSWFFPSDLIPHSTALKYSCKKLQEQGLLERRESCGRWGWQYRVSSEAEKEAGKQR